MFTGTDDGKSAGPRSFLIRVLGNEQLDFIGYIAAPRLESGWEVTVDGPVDLGTKCRRSGSYGVASLTSDIMF